MGRLFVEGYVEGQRAGTIPNTAAVVLAEGSADDSVAYRCAGGIQHNFLHDASPGILFNRDTILHNFDYFIRGTGVPGGSMDLTALYTFLNLDDPAAGVQLLMPMFFPLLAGQRYEVEMGEVVTTLAPTFAMAYRDVVGTQNDLRVSGRRLTQVLSLISTVLGPLVIDGPSADDDFTTRTVLMAGNAKEQLVVFNSGGIVADVTVTLTTPGGGLVVLTAITALAVGASIVVPVLNLTEGYSLSIATSTALAQLSAIGSYTDLV